MHVLLYMTHIHMVFMHLLYSRLLTQGDNFYLFCEAKSLVKINSYEGFLNDCARMLQYVFVRLSSRLLSFITTIANGSVYIVFSFFQLKHP